jgi:co-chaperonin GroES (HSP10)
MRASVLFLLLVQPAAGKDRPQYNYQDGILVSFRSEQNGTTCSHSSDTSGTVNAKTDDDGNTNGTVNATTTGRTSCQDTERTLYTVKSGDNTFVLTPDHGSGAKAGAVLSMGWSAAFMKRSVLANRMPGTTLLLRGDGKHYFVKIGDRESMFTAVEVR